MGIKSSSPSTATGRGAAEDKPTRLERRKERKAAYLWGEPPGVRKAAGAAPQTPELEPADKIIFSGKKLGEEAAQASIKITNTLKERIAYKVKCTSNEMFRIRPPVGALKPDDNVTVSLTFNAGKTVPDSGKHYFAVYYIKAPDEKKAPRATWADHKGEPEGTKRLYIDFKKEGEEEKKEEKKEEEKKEEKKDEEKKEEKKDEEKKEEKKDEEKKEEKKEEEKKEEKKEEEKKEEEKK